MDVTCCHEIDTPGARADIYVVFARGQRTVHEASPAGRTGIVRINRSLRFTVTLDLWCVIVQRYISDTMVHLKSSYVNLIAKIGLFLRLN